MRTVQEEVGSWMWTVSGRRFCLSDPRPEDVSIHDIAHSLSLQCRFAGHIRETYTVAQHSVLVSELCDPADALWGLLHDASEAYVVDLPRPVKEIESIHGPYKELEAKVQRAICGAFGLKPEQPASVHVADDMMVYAEMLDLMPSLPPDVRVEYGKRSCVDIAEIRPWPAPYARDMFLGRFAALTA